MGGEHDKLPLQPWERFGPQPEPKYGPETEPVSRPENNAVVLGFLPDRIDLGTVSVGDERVFDIASPVLFNGDGALITKLSRPKKTTSQPSAFRDQLQLDPEPLFDREVADSFALASAPMVPINTYGEQPGPVRLRFKPTRGGTMSTLVTLEVVGSDGSMDRKQIRVTATALEPKGRLKRGLATKSEPAIIVDNISLPNGERAFEGTVEAEAIDRPIDAETFDGAVSTAKNEAKRIVDSQKDGVDLAATEISSFKKAQLPPSLFDQLVDLAFMMGVAGIAGVVARFVAQNLMKIMVDGFAFKQTVPPGYVPPIAPPTPVVDKPPAKPPHFVLPLLTDGVKEGFKGISKVARKELSQETDEEREARAKRHEKYSTNPKNAFVAEQKRVIRERGALYENVPIAMSEQLRSEDPSLGRAAMLTLARGMAAAALVADRLQAKATVVEWVAALAHHTHGSSVVNGPDGNPREVTNLDNARSYGQRDWYKESAVPTHDAILDIHVELPVGHTPVETSGFKVTGASIQGVSQEVADQLRDVQLAHAGIPIRLVVRGHPALITRDELGRVRINGYLLTTDGGARWTEAHMHRGAKLLVDKVLSKTLSAWGIEKPATNDATGRGD